MTVKTDIPAEKVSAITEAAAALAKEAMVAAEIGNKRRALREAIEKRGAEVDAGNISDDAKDDAWLLMAHQLGWAR